MRALTPKDVILRIIDRLEESRQILDESLAGLHPRKDKDLIDAIIEVERLTQTQLNICRRVRRRLDREDR